MLKGKFSKFIVILVIILNIVFAGIVLYIFSITGTEPTALITMFFGFTTVELWQLARIKKSKTENQKSKENTEDESDE